MQMNYKNDFILNDSLYLLNHSVGRPLTGTKQAFYDAYLAPWEDATNQLWPQWLNGVDQFQQALGTLFNVDKSGFCPQVNLSSGLTKLVMSLDRLQVEKAPVLMSEIDFPTIGFALQKALPNGYDQIRFIPKDADITDVNVWAEQLASDVGMLFISHVYSNTGQQAPVAEILPLAAQQNILSVVDVAQSAGIVPLDLSATTPDFLLGSSVKWLCGGPGAGYLWINPERLDDCYPKDVGWFSHERPFEFDIHDFRYHPTALRFWGGTPSVAPFIIAAHSINYFNQLGGQTVRQHNQQMINLVANELDGEFVSPRDEMKRSGTMILHFGDQQEAMIQALQKANIQVDQRNLGMRVSPHIYNDAADMAYLLHTIKAKYHN